MKWAMQEGLGGVGCRRIGLGVSYVEQGEDGTEESAKRANTF